MSSRNVVEFSKPGDFSPDPLTEVLRKGAQDLLTTAIPAEVSRFPASHNHLLDEEGRQRLVRHGFLPEREVSDTPSPVRDRGHNEDGSKVPVWMPPVLQGFSEFFEQD